MSSLGYKIKKLRTEAGLTQSDLGKLVGLSKQAISKMENDLNKYLNHELVNRIAFQLKCTPDYLLGLSDERNSTRSNKIQIISIDPDAEVKIEMEKLCGEDLEFAKLILACKKKLSSKDMKRIKKILKTFIE
ncbi:transcriptional repressor DicA [Clostridium homopropionicum DSM 5847]|uniref:Transcriptional repressor DicA n=1 Tax=Clostridium homopropionicum DSM 5847 TaxID=1121318 RepID=A0A0L6ZC05_9CLOT|nr:helix-turn-helix transcriptional regulator [Clostridium homopropionicum]KOA20318.1 transcriptional repressor DicA [Clostridium homopropionicum DSM 5847]SFG93564.1 Transcriptional regulator, contains XRE-family HTH domain [Clostridium homopropionicum]